MLSDIFRQLDITEFAAVPVSMCKMGNKRLYDELPPDAYAIFTLFPYLCENKNSALAAFASVPDYHAFSKMLFALAEQYINKNYTNRFAHGYADHSPLDERHGAAIAGLGVIGRHGLIINEKYSSFICIGEFVCTLTEKELNFEGITTDISDVKHCADCGKCAAACPQRCVDASKETCISAINQRKGELTEDEKHALKQVGYAWGCDICQNVCPYTQKAKMNGTLYSKVPFFCRNVITGGLDEIEALSDEEYASYTFSYRKRNVMQRNIDILREKQ